MTDLALMDYTDLMGPSMRGRGVHPRPECGSWSDAAYPE